MYKLKNNYSKIKMLKNNNRIMSNRFKSNNNYKKNLKIFRNKMINK